MYNIITVESLCQPKQSKVFLRHFKKRMEWKMIVFLFLPKLPILLVWTIQFLITAAVLSCVVFCPERPVIRCVVGQTGRRLWSIAKHQSFPSFLPSSHSFTLHFAHTSNLRDQNKFIFSRYFFVVLIPVGRLIGPITAIKMRCFVRSISFHLLDHNKNSSASIIFPHSRQCFHHFSISSPIP